MYVLQEDKNFIDLKNLLILVFYEIFENEGQVLEISILVKCRYKKLYCNRIYSYIRLHKPISN